MKLTTFSAVNQRTALTKLFVLGLNGAKSPIVRETAIRMVAECEGRDDRCELEAVLNTVRSEVKYMTDPEIWTEDFSESVDHYTTPERLLEQCKRGVCAEDCDGMSSLIMALTGALGFQSGLRIFKPQGSKFYEHVYPIVGFPKLEPTRIIALDATVNKSLGWEPSGGEHLTAAIPNSDLAKLVNK